jgi:hypothetical protein
MTYYQTLAQELMRNLSETDENLLSLVSIEYNETTEHRVNFVIADVQEACKSLVGDDLRILALQQFILLFDNDEQDYFLSFKTTDSLIKTADIINRIKVAIQQYKKENVCN